MYKIKQIPEDFIVREINEPKSGDNGDYSYFLLKKKNYNTLKAIKIISEKLKIPEKSIGFAGNKDRNAVTEQLISIKNGNKSIEKINLKDIELKFIGKGDNEVFLGSHRGNEFIITIRNLGDEEIKNIEAKAKNNQILMPNYFGPQRFSNNNAKIGKSIIKKDFETAIRLITETNSDYNKKIKNHLEKKPNDYVVALKIIPLKLLKLYIHSYQSSLFNKVLEKLIKDKKITKNNHNRKISGDNKNKTIVENIIETLENSDCKISLLQHGVSNRNFRRAQKHALHFSAESVFDKIPVIGFGTELERNETGKTINKIMKGEKINERDFIIRQIPELSSEGTERNAFIKISDFQIIKKEEDELNQNKKKIIVKFSLPKGCYATVFIENLFG